jgi:CBS domain-containing protein
MRVEPDAGGERGADDRRRSTDSDRRIAMNVKDLMTREVVTISPEASLREVAATFLQHAISGAPVCDAEGHVLGVISQRDIVRKERGAAYPSGGLLSRFRAAGAPAKPEARTAGEAMTQPAVTVSAFTSVAGAARLMLEQGVHRLPVISQDKVCGIITETDLMRAFVRPDDEIGNEIRDELQWQLVELPGSTIECPTVEVTDGAVVVTGEVERRSDVETVDHVVRRVPGVESVTVNVTWRVDDRRASALR